MYDDKNKINSMYFKKNNKHKKKIKLHVCVFFILTSMFISLIFFNIDLKHFSKKDKILIKHHQNEKVLPPKPKEKWTYIRKLESL